MKKILALALAMLMVLALCACGAKEEAPAEVAVEDVAAPAAAAAPEAAPAAEGDASGEMGGATGEMPPLAASSEFEITVDGVTGIATCEETDNGDQETKGIVITWEGAEYNGTINKGVYTADNAANQPIFDAYKAAFEANNAVGPASAEPAA